jgi:iron complex outermembrane receptor protein
MHETPWGRGDLEASFGVDAGRTEIDSYDDLDYTSASGSEDGDDLTWTARLLGDHTLGERGDLRTAFTFADTRHDEALDAGAAQRYRQRLWSLAGETDWRFVGQVPVRLSVGLAADGADTPASGDKPPLEPLWDWGGRAGGTATFSSGVQAHGSISRRARFPSLRELYSGALGRFLPNPDLRPEAVMSAEAGLTARRGQAELQAVGFHQVIDDAVTRVSVSAPSGNLFQRVNLGVVRATGVELVGSFMLRSVELGADATLQRVRAEDASGAEQEMEYEPAISGGANAEMPAPLRTRFGIGVDFVGEQKGLNAETGNYDRIPAVGTVDLMLTRSFGVTAGPLARLDVVLALDNLFDAAAFDQLGLPQPGRTLRLQARLW